MVSLESFIWAHVLVRSRALDMTGIQVNCWVPPIICQQKHCNSQMGVYNTEIARDLLRKEGKLGFRALDRVPRMQTS